MFVSFLHKHFKITHLTAVIIIFGVLWLSYRQRNNRRKHTSAIIIVVLLVLLLLKLLSMWRGGATDCEGKTNELMQQCLQQLRTVEAQEFNAAWCFRGQRWQQCNQVSSPSSWCATCYSFDKWIRLQTFSQSCEDLSTLWGLYALLCLQTDRCVYLETPQQSVSANKNKASLYQRQF